MVASLLGYKSTAVSREPSEGPRLMASVLWYLTLLHVKALGRIYVTVVVKGQTRDIELFLGGSMDWQKTCNIHADCFSLFLIIFSYLFFMSYFLRRFLLFTVVQLQYFILRTESGWVGGFLAGSRTRGSFTAWNFFCCCSMQSAFTLFG